MRNPIFCKKCLVSVVCEKACDRILTTHKILKIVGAGAGMLFILSGMFGVVIMCLNLVDERTYLPIITIIQVVLTIMIIICIKLKSTLDCKFDLNLPSNIGGGR